MEIELPPDLFRVETFYIEPRDGGWEVLRGVRGPCGKVEERLKRGGGGNERCGCRRGRLPGEAPGRLTSTSLASHLDGVTGILGNYSRFFW